MNARRVAISLAAIALLSGLAWAWTRVEITQDNGPPVYHDAFALDLLDGELFAIHDDAWAVISFFRPPEAIPAGFDLFDDFDPAVFDTEVLIEGFVQFDDEGRLRQAQVQGLGAVPIWFVPWIALEAAAADGELLIDELIALDPLVGTATFFEEQNHVDGVHPVSHLVYLAQGTLEDGRAFDVRAVEVELELKHVQIELE